MIERLIQLEEDIRYQEFAPAGEPEFVHVKGSIPILISAPHGAAHTRNGKPKDEDEFTGGMTQLIGQETGAHVLYARRNSATDPNFDPAAPYKKKLTEIVAENGITFVLDIHGVRANRPFGIELGTAYGKSCSLVEKTLIIQTLEEFGFLQGNPVTLHNLQVDQNYAGAGKDGEETVTRFVYKQLGVSAAQFELNAYLRIPQRKIDATHKDIPLKGDPEEIIRAIRAFTCITIRLAYRANHF